MATTPGELLAEGWSLVVFPEGTRSPDGWVGRFRLGAAYLAAEHGVPVVPIAHRGTFAAMPRGQGWPGPGRRRLTIRFGEPLRPARARARATSRRGSSDAVARAARRGRDDLVGGPAPRGRRHHPRPVRPAGRAVAAGLGADGDPYRSVAHRASASGLAGPLSFTSLVEWPRLLDQRVGAPPPSPLVPAAPWPPPPARRRRTPGGA